MASGDSIIKFLTWLIVNHLLIALPICSGALCLEGQQQVVCRACTTTLGLSLELYSLSPHSAAKSIDKSPVNSGVKKTSCMALPPRLGCTIALHRDSSQVLSWCQA